MLVTPDGGARSVYIRWPLAARLPLQFGPYPLDRPNHVTVERRKPARTILRGVHPTFKAHSSSIPVRLTSNGCIEGEPAEISVTVDVTPRRLASDTALPFELSLR